MAFLIQEISLSGWSFYRRLFEQKFSLTALICYSLKTVLHGMNLIQKECDDDDI